MGLGSPTFVSVSLATRTLVTTMLRTRDRAGGITMQDNEFERDGSPQKSPAPPTVGGSLPTRRPYERPTVERRVPLRRAILTTGSLEGPAQD